MNNITSNEEAQDACTNESYVLNDLHLSSCEPARSSSFKATKFAAKQVHKVERDNIEGIDESSDNLPYKVIQTDKKDTENRDMMYVGSKTRDDLARHLNVGAKIDNITIKDTSANNESLEFLHTNSSILDLSPKKIRPSRTDYSGIKSFYLYASPVSHRHNEMSQNTVLECTKRPPSTSKVIADCKNKHVKNEKDHCTDRNNEKSQIEVNTETSKNVLPCNEGFSNSPNISAQNLHSAKIASGSSNSNCQYINVFSMECYIKTRQKLQPDPDFDSVEAIFYAIENDVPESTQNKSNKGKGSRRSITGIIVVDPLLSLSSLNRNMLYKMGISYFDDVSLVESEECLFSTFIETVQRYDPDILVGYDAETYSYGYLARRAAVKGKK